MLNLFSEFNTELAQILEKQEKRLILAESCTAGLVSASLGLVPGISKHLCGSFVVYRPKQKENILNVPSYLIAKFTTESKEISDWLAKEALTLTPEANCSGAIVGHLGPNAPESKDGQVWISVNNKVDNRIKYNHWNLKLKSHNREERMIEASSLLLKCIIDLLKG